MSCSASVPTSLHASSTRPRIRRTATRRPAIAQPLETRRLFAVTEFTIAPQLSRLAAFGLIVSDDGLFNEMIAATYNNPAALAGTVRADVGTTSIAFPGGSDIDALPGTATVDPGGAVADYHFETELIEAIALAFRDIGLDLTGTSPLTAGQTSAEKSFPIGALTTAFDRGTLDYTVGMSLRARPLAGLAANAGVENASVVRGGGFLTLSLPIDAVFEIPLDGSAIDLHGLVQYVELSGTIVAKASLGPVGSISGAIANDLNDDGIRQPNEPGLGRRTVYLDTNNNGRLDEDEATALTNTRGQYRFNDVTGGTYRVRLVGESGWRLTTGDSGYTVRLEPGRSSTNRHFLLTRRARIGGQVVVDTNGSYRRDKGDTPFADRLVYLDANDNGKRDDGERGTWTDAQGRYLFNALAPGNYVVRLENPTYGDMRLRPLTPDAGVHRVAAGTGANVRGRDYLLTGFARASGRLFDDRNNNGRRDPGEGGLKGVVMYLDLNDNGRYDKKEPTSTTNAGGYWAFERVSSGDVAIRARLPDRYRPTRPADGAIRLRLTSGQSAAGQLFGAKRIE